MSGGKGGSETTTVKIPEWLETAAKGNLSRADEVARIGYTPYYGPDVAALTPMQQAAMQNTNQGASAFGLAAPTDPMAGMPQAQTFAGGVQGYSAAPMYQQALDQLRAQNPAQFAAMTSMFIDPVTGALPSGIAGGGPTQTGITPLPTPPRDGAQNGRLSDYLRTNNPSVQGTTSLDTPASYAYGGVNTGNPNSIANRLAAAATSGWQGAPTAADRPMARPAGRNGTSSSMGSGK